jgi:uncharacterized membrane protein
VYELLLTVHVLAAVIWVGGNFVMDLMGRRVLKRGDGAEIHQFSQEVNAIGVRLYPGTSLVLLIAGILLVNEAGYDFGDAWVLLGLGGWLFSFFVGLLYYMPQDKKLQALVEERGASDPGVAENVRAALRVGLLENVVLLLVVIDMTVKPGA